MPKGVYLRPPRKTKAYGKTGTKGEPGWFTKGSIPHNKDKQSGKVLTKLAKLRAGEPIFCKTHGEHSDWRIHSDNNVQCNLCIRMWSQNRRSRNPIKTLLLDAKHRKLDFDLTEEGLASILAKQQNRCSLSGVVFDEDNKMSLDRIDSEKGYLEGNVQFVLLEINKMKTDLPQERFIELCCAIAGKKN